MISFVSDVHGAFGPLGRLVESDEQVVVLGDLANLTDYRTGEGAVAEVLGLEFALEAARARGANDYEAMRSLWVEQVGDSIEDVRAKIGQAINGQYSDAAEQLAKGSGWVIHGNVDHPEALAESLPDSFHYVHGEVINVDSLRLGLVGGGMTTPIRARGEVSDEEMASLLDELGPVDILCTHVPPSLQPLRHDVITGREERGSRPILEYVEHHQPLYHLYGDVHQARATSWRIGRTTCLNAGYFRATGRYLRLEDGLVRTVRIR